MKRIKGDLAKKLANHRVQVELSDAEWRQIVKLISAAPQKQWRLKWKRGEADEFDVLFCQVPRKTEVREVGSGTGRFGLSFILNDGIWASAVVDDREEIDAYEAARGLSCWVVGRLTKNRDFTNIRPYLGALILDTGEAPEDIQFAAVGDAATETNEVGEDAGDEPIFE